MKGALTTTLILAGIAFGRWLAPSEVRVMPLVLAGEHIAVIGPTEPPTAFLDFCAREPEQCTPKLGYGRTKDDVHYLGMVNAMVNALIRPATDAELYGRAEFWALPETAGDCEDIALLKRKYLIEAGWPSSALLITVVQKRSGEGHAVLMARTAYGDLILDSVTDEIRIWHRTSYTFVSRQSERHPQEWVELPGAFQRYQIGREELMELLSE